MNLDTGKKSAAFKITQKDHSKGILLALLDYFKCGKIYTRCTTLLFERIIW
jgi:hypothetical protein